MSSITVKKGFDTVFVRYIRCPDCQEEIMTDVLSVVGTVECTTCKRYVSWESVAGFRINRDMWNHLLNKSNSYAVEPVFDGPIRSNLVHIRIVSKENKNDVIDEYDPIVEVPYSVKCDSLKSLPPIY